MYLESLVSLIEWQQREPNSIERLVVKYNVINIWTRTAEHCVDVDIFHKQKEPTCKNMSMSCPHQIFLTNLITLVKLRQYTAKHKLQRMESQNPPKRHNNCNLKRDDNDVAQANNGDAWAWMDWHPKRIRSGTNTEDVH